MHPHPTWFKYHRTPQKFTPFGVRFSIPDSNVYGSGARAGQALGLLGTDSGASFLRCTQTGVHIHGMCCIRLCRSGAFCPIFARFCSFLLHFCLFFSTKNGLQKGRARLRTNVQKCAKTAFYAITPLVIPPVAGHRLVNKRIDSHIGSHRNSDGLYSPKDSNRTFNRGELY